MRKAPFFTHGHLLFYLSGYNQIRTGIDANFRFHDLRHTAASWQLQDGATLETIRKFLAHTDITTTARYLHSDDRDVDQASARTLESLL